MAKNRVTLQDIAAACGLSRNTVSKVFNSRGTVPESTRQQVLTKAREMGYEGLFVPESNVREAAVVNRIKVYGVKHILDVVGFLSGTTLLEPTIINTREEFYANQSTFNFDFDEVKGQENVKRAFEVAAAGGHNIILVGSPGCGKSMMAKRLPSILPPLSLAESLETTQIHSVAGKLTPMLPLWGVVPISYQAKYVWLIMEFYSLTNSQNFLNLYWKPSDNL